MSGEEVEEWAPIPGREATHEISSFGRLRSLTYGFRYGSKRRAEPKILAGRLNNTGYLRIAFCNPAKDELVHRLVLLAFRGAPDDPRADGSHLDGNSTNNRLSNLIWESRRENLARKVAHGTQTRGETSPTAKLSTVEAIDIARRYENGETQASIARQYNINPSSVSRIVTGRRWRHLRHLVAVPPSIE